MRVDVLNISFVTTFLVAIFYYKKLFLYGHGDWNFLLLRYIHHHHHHHSSSEDMSGGFFFLEKMFVPRRFVHHTIFKISVASKAFSPCRKWVEICCLYFLTGAPGRRDGLTLDSYKTKRLMGSSVGIKKQWPVNLSCRSRIISRIGTWLTR